MTTNATHTRTLADMTEWERGECLWMQADVKGRKTRVAIIYPHWEPGVARVVSPGGFVDPIDWREITPRPDLPRLEWPIDKNAEID